MGKIHRVIIGPGLDGRTGGIKFLVRNWPKRYGLYPEVVKIVWKDGQGFEVKLQKILDLIDKSVKNRDKVSLIGCSASGSLMLNAFIERKHAVDKVVNLSGFLRRGKAKGLRFFDVRSAKSPAFRQSVIHLEKKERSLSMKDRKKILTVRPLYDELVPGDTVVLKGALNKTIPVIEHILGISTALVSYDPLIKFLH